MKSTTITIRATSAKDGKWNFGATVSSVIDKTRYTLKSGKLNGVSLVLGTKIVREYIESDMLPRMDEIRATKPAQGAK